MWFAGFHATGDDMMRLTRTAWDEAEDPGVMWANGTHVSSKAPALAAVLLGDVESEGAHGGVALSPAAVASVAGALAAVMARPSSSGSFVWHVARFCRVCMFTLRALSLRRRTIRQACAARAVVRLHLRHQ